MRLIIVALGAIGLILFVAFIGARLVRSRTAGISIRMQVFLALASIVGAFAFGLGLLVIDRIEARATLLAEESARAEASAVATLFAGEVASGVSLDEVVERLEPAQRRGALSFALLDESGRTVFESGLSPTEPGTVSMTAPILVQGREIGLVRVVKPTIVIERMLTDFAPTVLVISLVLGAAAAASAALIGRAIAAPIEGLTDFAERVSEGRARASPPPPQGREVQRLTQAIDSMRRQIEGRPFVETFAADLSHELKNPVAAIRASAEVLADGALDEPDEAERFVSRILESTGRIEALLGDLLSLARIEARGVENAELCDMVAIAKSVAADSASARVEIEGGAGSVRGDPKWLTRALDNLLDNAVTHGVPGSVVRVTIERARSEVSVFVESEGEVGRHVKPRLFRRFVTTRADRGGTGLGLAIVRAVAEAHGGSAECVEPGPPRVRFRLVLPGS
jgi:two-component system, OmpR family, sensor histidine kinase CreC